MARKGIKLSEKSLSTRMANPKARKRGLVRFMEQGSIADHAAKARDENANGTERSK